MGIGDNTVVPPPPGGDKCFVSLASEILSLQDSEHAHEKNWVGLLFIAGEQGQRREGSDCRRRMTFGVGGYRPAPSATELRPFSAMWSSGWSGGETLRWRKRFISPSFLPRYDTWIGSFLVLVLVLMLVVAVAVAVVVL